MKKLKLKTSVILMTPFFGLALAAPVYAAGDAHSQTAQATQTQKSSAQTTPAQTQRATMRDMRLSQLIGKDVRNAQGEDLGDIKDVILDVNHGHVHYVVLSFGGFLGLGDKLFAYPVRAFSPASDKDELVLNVAKERLKAAPGFDANKYPDFSKADYRQQVDRYFGPTMAIEAQPNMRLVRGTELLGKDINDPNGRDLGEIEDVVVNMGNGNVHYAVLEFDQSWSLKDKLFAFPLRSFKQGARWSDDLVLNISKDTLNNVPGFDKNNRPSLNDQKWITDVDRYLVATTVVPLPSTTNDALWGRLDANQDGWLSSDEAKKDNSVLSNWKKMDRDNDGRISHAEFNAAYRK